MFRFIPIDASDWIRLNRIDSWPFIISNKIQNVFLIGSEWFGSRFLNGSEYSLICSELISIRYFSQEILVPRFKKCIVCEKSESELVFRAIPEFVSKLLRVIQNQSENPFVSRLKKNGQKLSDSIRSIMIQMNLNQVFNPELIRPRIHAD